jgi:hypothetical protein
LPRSAYWTASIRCAAHSGLAVCQANGRS